VAIVAARAASNRAQTSRTVVSWGTRQPRLRKQKIGRQRQGAEFGLERRKSPPQRPKFVCPGPQPPANAAKAAYSRKINEIGDLLVGQAGLEPATRPFQDESDVVFGKFAELRRIRAIGASAVRKDWISCSNRACMSLRARGA
jgi:hypothetical protein